jgi:hypothetical protein
MAEREGWKIPDFDARACTDEHEASAAGHDFGHVDPVERALADALTRMAAAGDVAAVLALTAELKARREARAARR